MKKVNTWVVGRDEFIHLNPPIKVFRETVEPNDLKRIFPVLHNHYLPEIEFLAKGTAVHTINGTTIESIEGNIYMMSPQDIHKIDASDDSLIFSVCFSESVLPFDVLKCFSFSATPFHALLTGDSYNRVFNAFEALLSEQSSDKMCRPTLMKNLLSEIVIEILRNCVRDFSFTSQSQTKAKDAILYINENYSYDISLESVAAKIGITPQHLSKIFNESIGMHFSEYIRTIRMQHAYKILCNTSKSITDTCFECGYNSPSHFSKIFKEHFGISPSEVQNKLK